MKAIAIAFGCAWIIAFMTEFRRGVSSTKVVPVECGANKFQIDPVNVDLGTIIPEHGIVWVNCAVKNLSDASKKLCVVSKSCGCIEVLLPEVLPPSGVGLIRIAIDPRKKQGYQRVLAQIGFDNGEVVDCTLKYNSLASILAIPDFMHVDDADGHKAITRDIQVWKRVGRNEPLTPPDVVCERDDVHVRLHSTADDMNPLAPYRHAIFRYEVTVPAANAEIPIRFRDDENEAFVNFRVRVRHHPFILGPTAAVVNEGNQKPTLVVLWARDGHTFAIDRVESSVRNVSAVAITSGDLRVHRIQISATEHEHIDTKDETLRVFIKGCDTPYLLNIVVRKPSTTP